MRAEIELIASVLREPEQLANVEAKPAHFSSPVYAAIWRVIVDLSLAGPWDRVAVQRELGDDSEAGKRVDQIIAESVGKPTNAAQYSSMVLESWRRRKEAELMQQREADEITRAEHITALLELDASSQDHLGTIADATREMVEEMHEIAEADGELRGIKSGLADLDRHIGGWKPGELIIIGARPAMGKTALMLHCAQSAGVPVGVISAEMPRMQLAFRHAASIGRVSLHDLRNKPATKKEHDAVKIMHNTLKDYYIYDRSKPTITDVIRVARMWRHKHDIQALYVDYIQRIEGVGRERHHEVGHVAQALKTLARDLEIPVIVLAQVNRTVERDGKGRRPGMGDLADSSEIEKEADQVLTLYRDEVYNPDSPDSGIAEIAICKNRSGYTGIVKAAWIGDQTRFADLAYGDGW